MRERRVFPLDPAFLPSKVLDQLEKETGKQVLRLTVPTGEIGVYEVVLGDRREEAE